MEMMGQEANFRREPKTKKGLLKITDRCYYKRFVSSRRREIGQLLSGMNKGVKEPLQKRKVRK